MKEFYESKTVWLGLMTSALSILTFLQGEAWIVEYPVAVSTIGTVVGLLTIALRYVTKVPMRLTK
jgi:hypothetical protein